MVRLYGEMTWGVEGNDGPSGRGRRLYLSCESCPDLLFLGMACIHHALGLPQWTGKVELVVPVPPGNMPEAADVEGFETTLLGGNSLLCQPLLCGRECRINPRRA